MRLQDAFKLLSLTLCLQTALAKNVGEEPAEARSGDASPLTTVEENQEQQEGESQQPSVVSETEENSSEGISYLG